MLSGRPPTVTSILKARHLAPPRVKLLTGMNMKRSPVSRLRQIEGAPSGEPSRDAAAWRRSLSSMALAATLPNATLASEPVNILSAGADVPNWPQPKTGSHSSAARTSDIRLVGLAVVAS